MKYLQNGKRFKSLFCLIVSLCLVFSNSPQRICAGRRPSASGIFVVIFAHCHFNSIWISE
uniref:Acyltransferase n=1 Tax=Heterorhabditis bacteriophora TaxID=37862 RepID=A0A1I7W7B7_HETBA